MRGLLRTSFDGIGNDSVERSLDVSGSSAILSLMQPFAI